MHCNPEPQHARLKKFVGNWAYDSEVVMGPDQPPIKSSGTETGRMLGDVWMIADGKGEMPGGATGTTMMTIGYDPERKRFVGSWVGSMMTQMWVYDGELDAAGQTLTLNTTGPDCSTPGKTSTYKDVISFKNDNERTLTSSMQGPDGEWRQFMKATYRRVK